ncbi:FliH/SctL family protein [Rhabdaerophilum sp. SD176]|uniref:FliH/SctL family protein n=1 Tax=Rhabdaerophilum sp. SD176 TaxID=2983548 RepID=UPI0024E01312|nr:FliH/SctL family protein [Rhabdaerophilum sp. SD176]
MLDEHEPTGYVLKRLPARTQPGANKSAEAVPPSPADLAKREAEAIIEQARRQADIIISRAEGAATKLVTDIEAKARQRSEDILSQQLLAYHQQFHLELDRAYAEMVRLVRDAVEMVIGSFPPEQQVAGLIHKAVLEIGQNQGLVLRVPPAEMDRFRQAIEALMARGEVISARVQADPDLTPGLCRLEASGLHLDIGLASQLSILEARLKMDSAEPSDPRTGRD